MSSDYLLASEKSMPPTTWSYWVVEGQLLAGAFPESLDPAEHRQRKVPLAGKSGR